MSKVWFKEVSDSGSRIFQERINKVFQNCFMGVQGGFKGIWWKDWVCFKSFSGIFHVFLRLLNVLLIFDSLFQKGYKGFFVNFYSVSGVRCLKSDSKRFKSLSIKLDVSRIFLVGLKKMFKVFQSFMLYVTHRSLFLKR